jgi:hypothetical protein
MGRLALWEAINIMNKLVIICTNQSLSTTLEKIFSGNGRSIAHYSLPLEKDIPEFEPEDVLVIQEPILVNNNYLSASFCWKNYLKLHSPRTILLSAGFGKVQDPNYLDLLKLPTDIENVLFNARTTEEEWIPRTTGGVDVLKKLYRFFEGHGAESFTDELHKMLRICKIARDELKIHQADYSEVREELLLPNKLPDKWNVLQSRWQFYQPYFLCLPYYGEFAKMGSLFKDIAPFFTNDCAEEDLFWETACVEQLEDLKTGLEKIENLYAR